MPGAWLAGCPRAPTTGYLYRAISTIPQRIRGDHIPKKYQSYRQIVGVVPQLSCVAAPEEFLMRGHAASWEIPVRLSWAVTVKFPTESLFDTR